MKKLIVIADWASDTLTCQEFRTSVEGFSKNPGEAKVSFVSSTPSPLHTSFLMNQIVEIEERFGRPQETVIFVNTDPRLQSPEGLDQAKGADFIVAKLVSGLYVCGPNAGYGFSMIKPKMDELFIYRDLDKGSQFRSRDLYSRVSAHLMDTLEHEMDLEELHTSMIPELRGWYVGHVDNFGNIKTTIRLSDLKGSFEFGDEVKMRIHDVEKTAVFAHNLFSFPAGTLVIYPGSSGKREDPYMEISIRRNFTEKDASTGLQVFNFPKPGMGVEIVR